MTKIEKNDIENIKNLEKELKSRDLSSIKIKKGNYEIEISKENKQTIEKIQKKELPLNAGQTEDIIQSSEINKENIVTSPMVGVVYLSSDPSHPPFVKEGQHVKQGDVLLLIEAMKTFNEIKAPKSGVIKKIIALNSQPVEFGETLIIFE
jgi:acetyl-CoA carboxylase biotin carboxyl carrier protein